MRLTPLLDRWTDDPAFATLLATLATDGAGQRAEVVVPDVAQTFLLARIAQLGGRLDPGQQEGPEIGRAHV